MGTATALRLLSAEGNAAAVDLNIPRFHAEFLVAALPDLAALDAAQLWLPCRIDLL